MINMNIELRGLNPTPFTPLHRDAELPRVG